jgi:hypothetical protein
MVVRWHVREITRVDNDELASEMNAAQDQGWSLQRIDYVREAGVRRPVMAFLFFTSDESPVEDSDITEEEMSESGTGAW